MTTLTISAQAGHTVAAAYDKTMDDLLTHRDDVLQLIYRMGHVQMHGCPHAAPVVASLRVLADRLAEVANDLDAAELRAIEQLGRPL